jgi:hypothetical protein
MSPTTKITEIIDLRKETCPCCGTRPAPTAGELIEADRLVDLLAAGLLKIRGNHADEADVTWWYADDGRREGATETLRRLIALARERGGS